MMRLPLLQIDNLCIELQTPAGRVPAIDGVSFHLARGETLGLVGESGCGKSLTALSILGLTPSPPVFVASGSVRFEGKDLLDLDAEALRSIRGDRIAMIFQEPMSALNPVLTIGRQLTESLMAHRRLSRRAARRRAVEWLGRVRIPAAQARLRDYPHQLSGGMRQRVMIAMAMICRPAMIIADEPTTALDAPLQAQILALMMSLREELGMSLLLVSHDMGVIAQTADRVAVMYAGQVAESAATPLLFEAPFHPYTRGLLASIPRPARRHGEAPSRLREIRGSVPALTETFAGCRFAPRCRHAFDRCRKECPPLESLTPSHSVRCWLRRYPESRRIDE